MPQISVIVPLYNVERYVGDAVRSLQAQAFGDFEAILVDDGSTDETLAEARAAIGDDARFSIVQQANCGPATARKREEVSRSAPMCSSMVQPCAAANWQTDRVQ